jgi:hypothetical protein
MWTSSFIRRHIFSLPEGTVFTTRDFLTYGRRGAVDLALYRLVKSGLIRRLARGVFVRDPFEKMKFSHFEIAKVKAESFGRRITIDPPIQAQWPKLDSRQMATTQTEVTFFIDGRTSSFHIGDQVIHLKQISPRKLTMSGNKAGLHMRALWQMGEEALSDIAIQEATMTFTRTDNLDMRRSARWMPAWLCNRFNFGRRWEPAA